MPNAPLIPASVWREDAAINTAYAKDLADADYRDELTPEQIATDDAIIARLRRAAAACEQLAALAEHETKWPNYTSMAETVEESFRRLEARKVWSDKRNSLVNDLLRGPTP